ncbi:MAG TPA: TonB-dependent receptor [Longimicrobiales bacterium]|nr:TonB-dependent receptor [Longimicrobiales bacterium]
MRHSAAAALVVLACAAPAGRGLNAQQPVPLDTLYAATGSRLVAGAAAATRSLDVFDRAAIEALPAGSVADVIARALGADLRARSPAQADVSIRGGSFEQILVLVDGVPVNDRQTGHFHLDVAVPLDAVERVEVLRGPASAIYGSSAVGGVVNIVTRRGVSELRGRVQGGTFGSYALAGDAAHSRGATAVRIDAELDASDGHRDGTDHRTRQARASLSTPLGSGVLNTAAAYAARDFGASQFYAPFDSYEETRTATLAAAWRSQPRTVAIEPRVSFRQHEDDFILRRDDPSFYRNVHTTRETAAEIVTRWQARTGLSLAGGGEASHSRIESSSLGDRDEHQIAAFAEAALGDASGGLLTLGVRLDRHSAFGTFVSSSAAAGYRLSPAFRLRASAGSGFRAPSWTDRYYEDPANIGSPDLEPERFWTAEIGTEITAGAAVLDLAGFVRTARDLIDWGRPRAGGGTEPWRTLNVTEASFRGLEATGRVAAGGIITLTARASLLSFEATQNDGFESKYALQPLTRSASLELALPVTAHGRLAIGGSASRRADGTSWETLDARASARVRRVELFADATNLLDASWPDVSAQPAAGRAFSIGMRMRR